jgi:hypothetical protein
MPPLASEELSGLLADISSGALAGGGVGERENGLLEVVEDKEDRERLAPCLSNLPWVLFG